MNSAQLKHALARAASIYNKRYQELSDKFTIPAVKLDGAGRSEAATQGRFSFLPSTFTDRYHRPPGYPTAWWTDTFCRWVVFTDERIEEQKPGCFEALAQLTAAHERLKDFLYLGETSEALKLLEAFAGGGDPK